FYAIVILLEPRWNFYHSILLGIDLLFIFTFGFLLYKKYNLLKLLFLFTVLGIANIRWVSPVENFYFGFHELVWFGMFVFSTFLLIKESYLQSKKIGSIAIGGAIILFLGMVSFPGSYLWEKLNREQSFTINYEKYSTNKKLITLLSHPADTLFIDNWD